MSDMDTEITDTTFRAPKRRKIFRSRVRDEDEELRGEAVSTLIPASRTEGLNPDEPELSVAEILRRRRAGKPRRAGIEFSATKSGTQSTPSAAQSTALVLMEEDKTVLEPGVNRFMREQGPVKASEVTSKHM
jgi:hypothetical protein